MRKFKVLCAAMVVMLLSGCVKAEYAINVRSEKEMDISASILMAPALYQSSGDGLSDNVKEQTSEDVSFTIENIEEKIGEETWKGIKATAALTEEQTGIYVKNDGETLSFDMTVAQFEELFGENPTEQMEENPMMDGNLVFGNAELEATEDNELSEDLDTDEIIEDEVSKELELLTAAMGQMSFKIKITMPNEPTTNVGEVEGNTVIIDMMSDDYNNLDGAIQITCKAPFSLRSDAVIYGGIALGFIAFIAVLVVLNKKFSEY